VVAKTANVSAGLSPYFWPGLGLVVVGGVGAGSKEKGEKVKSSRRQSAFLL